MKIFNLLFTASLFLCLASCSDDDSSEPNEGFVGKWEVTGIDYTGTSTTESYGQTFTVDFVGTGTDLDLEIEFKENPMDYTTSGDYSIELDVDFMGQMTTQTYTNQGFIGAGTWAQVGNTLVVSTEMDGEQIAEIISMTADVIVLGYDFTITQTQNGAVATTNLEGTYTFERE